MKVALAHDFLIRWGGAEKVLFDLHKIFPEAPIFTLFYDKKFVDEHFPNIKIRSSYLQRRYAFLRGLTWIFTRIYTDIHRILLPWMPIAVESFDFSDYDLVISSSSGFMKGIIVPIKTKHICYLHTPTRWALQDTKQKRNFKDETNTKLTPKEIGVNLRNYQRKSASESFLKRAYTHFYRIWDFEAAQRPDILIANSRYTAQRIRKYYKRRADVVYPGVDIHTKLTRNKTRNNTKNISIDQHQPSKYFIVVSRLSSYKHVDWAIEAFKNLPYNLVIVGEGPTRKNSKFKIQNSKLRNKIFLRDFIRDKNKLMDLIKGSVALIHLAEEDFGIAIVEALKLGKPAIVYNKGGARELIKEGISGEFFTNKQDLSDIIKKVAENIGKYKPAVIKKSVEGFSSARFKKEIQEIWLNG